MVNRDYLSSFTPTEQPLLDKYTSTTYYDGMKKKRSRTLSDAVRKAIDDSGESRYAIAKATGIDESALAKFYNGHRGITTDTLDRLGEYLALRIVMDRKPKPKGK